MGADGFGLESARQRQDFGLFDRQGKVVGPEVHQPLQHWGGRGERLQQAGLHRVVIPLARGLALGLAQPHFFAGVGGLAQLFGLLRQYLHEGGAIRLAGWSRRGRRAQLFQHPLARLGRRRFVGAGAQAEAVQGNGGVGVHGGWGVASLPF